MIVATGLILLGRLERVDLCIGLPQYLQAIADRMQGGFCRGEIRLRLLPVLKTPALGFVQRVLASLVDARELQLRRGGIEIVLRLNELRGLNRRERRALFHRIAESRDHARDAAGIR